MGCNDVLYLCATPESIHCSFGSSLETQLAHESSLSHQRPLLDNHPKVLSVFQSRFQSRRSPKPERSVPTSQAPKWAFIVEVGKLLAQLFSAHGSNRQLCHGHSRFFLGGIWTCIPQWESWNWVCIKKSWLSSKSWHYGTLNLTESFLVNSAKMVCLTMFNHV